jgi:type IV pilus assembly protein PilB
VSNPPPPPAKKRRLGELLKDAGLVSELQLKAALSEQRKWGGKLGRTLVEMGFVDETSMAAALSRQLQLPLVDLEAAPLPPDVTQWLRVDIAERYGVFPLGGDHKQKILHVATSDPTNFEALQELAFSTGMRIQASIAGPTSIEKAIRSHYYGERVTAQETTTPNKLGVPEPTFDAQDIIKRSGQAAAGADDSATPLMASAAFGSQADPYAVSQLKSPVQAELAKQIKDLSDRLDALEKAAAGQVKAVRALLELLIEKGHVTRDEYVARARGAKE